MSQTRGDAGPVISTGLANCTDPRRNFSVVVDSSHCRVVGNVEITLRVSRHRRWKQKTSFSARAVFSSRVTRRSGNSSHLPVAADLSDNPVVRVGDEQIPSPIGSNTHWIFELGRGRDAIRISTAAGCRQGGYYSVAGYFSNRIVARIGHVNISRPVHRRRTWISK